MLHPSESVGLSDAFLPFVDAGLIREGYRDRQVYGLMGIPIDALSIEGAVDRIRDAVERKKTALISTPNLNFLVTSLADRGLRQSLLVSEFCPVDGVPLVWMCKLLGIPIRNRVAGADIFEALKAPRSTGDPLRVFFFGGLPGVADAAARSINCEQNGVICVGSLDPGFGSLDDLSAQEIIDRINASEADFLVVALGAQKGQEWLLRNHDRIKVPVRSHLGAVVAFQSGKLKRAPELIRKSGFEWLWRVKEEPHLWKRYWRDGCIFLMVLCTRVLPLMIINAARRLFTRGTTELVADYQTLDSKVCVRLKGPAVVANFACAEASLRRAAESGKDVSLDLSQVDFIDARFFGLFLQLRRSMNQHGRELGFVGANRWIRRLFWLNAFDFLLEA